MPGIVLDISLYRSRVPPESSSEELSFLLSTYSLLMRKVYSEQRKVERSRTDKTKNSIHPDVPLMYNSHSERLDRGGRKARKPRAANVPIVVARDAN